YAGLAAMALPPAYYMLSVVGGRLSWKRFVNSSLDMAVPGAAAALALSVVGWMSWSTLAVAIAVAGALAVGYLAASSREGARVAREAGHAVGAGALAVSAAIQVCLVEERIIIVPELTLAFAAAMQARLAFRQRMRALEYSSLALFGVAYVLGLRDGETDLHKYCLAVAALPVAFYALSFAARRRNWPAFSGSAFDMAAPAAALSLVLALTLSTSGPSTLKYWHRADLWYAVAASAILGAVYLALSYTDNPRKWLHPVAANFAGSALAALSYLLVLKVFSTGTPYRALWIMGVAPLIIAYGLILDRKGMRPRGSAAIAVGVLVTVLALWQAMRFPDKPLVATLAFAVAAATFGVISAMRESAYFGAAASAAFSVAYFSLIRKLGVPANSYVLWLAALGILQVLVGGLGRRGERQRRPATFVGMALAIGVSVWMIARGEVYFARGSREIDFAIWTTLGAAVTFGIVALLRRSWAAALPAAAGVLGSYYLVLHRFAVTSTEFYTVPVALMLLAWSRLVVRRKYGPSRANFSDGVGLALLVVPSLALSLDMNADAHLFHMLAAFALSIAAVVAGMVLRRKVYLAGGAVGFAIEGCIKLFHFKLKHEVSNWIWLLVIGVVIIGFVLYAETKRNKRLREAADEAKARLARMFEKWE
ncbi:MAG: SCO7613 C-terminal domain-containing membrane protein, partial [Planctomycetota bacterium]